MAFRLSRRRALSVELRRNLDRQLQLAAARLREPGTPDADDGIHEARRHIKKARAVLRLFEPILGQDGRAADHRLRTIGRLLGPIADGESVLETLTRVHRRYARQLPRPARSALRRALQRREARIDREAREDSVISTALALLQQERAHWHRWRGAGNGFRLIAGGLRTTFDVARQRQRETLRGFDPETTHAWRRRVKSQWYQMRLLDRRCGRAIAGDRRRLETLDGYLGEIQNATLLLEVLTTTPSLSAPDRRRYRSVIARYQAMLSRRASRLGQEIYREKPGHFVRRVRRLWRAERRRSGQGRT